MCVCVYAWMNRWMCWELDGYRSRFKRTLSIKNHNHEEYCYKRMVVIFRTFSCCART